MCRRTLCTLLGLLTLATAAWADSQARIVRLSYVEGDVQMDRADSRGFTRAFVNMPVIEGARLWAHNDARVEVEFEDGSTARLTPDTILEFRQLRLQNDGRLTLMNVQEGQVYFNIKKRKEDDIRITVGEQLLDLQKPSHFRIDVNRDEMSLAVFKGDLEILKHNGERVQIRKNETLTLNFNDPDRYFLARNINEDEHDYWDRERDKDVETYARNHSVPGYSSAYAYGLSDLNRYGTFISVNNYGSVWQPYGVGYGWQPFQDGSWAWYPGQGYVWVSAYPWGWTPYRYGSWINVPGYGWCWRAGQHWNNWAPVPVVVAPPSTFVAPTPPPTPGVSIVHVGHGGDPGRDRPFRGPRISIVNSAATGSSTATPTPTTSGSGAVNAAPDMSRGRGGRNVITNDNLNGTNTFNGDSNVDRLGRDRSSRIAPVNTTPVAAPVTTPTPVQSAPASSPL